MLHFWYQAAASDFGIVLVTEDVQRLIQKLYAARRASGDESLKALSLIQSPIDSSHLWIVRTNASERHRTAAEAHPEPNQG